MSDPNAVPASALSLSPGIKEAGPTYVVAQAASKTAETTGRRTNTNALFIAPLSPREFEPVVGTLGRYYNAPVLDYHFSSKPEIILLTVV
jgi:hypothetical protein